MRQEINNAVFYKRISLQNVHKALDVSAIFRTLVYFYRLRDDPYLVCCTVPTCTYVCMYVFICMSTLCIAGVAACMYVHPHVCMCMITVCHWLHVWSVSVCVCVCVHTYVLQYMYSMYIHTISGWVCARAR